MDQTAGYKLDICSQRCVRKPTFLCKPARPQLVHDLRSPNQLAAETPSAIILPCRGAIKVVLFSGGRLLRIPNQLAAETPQRHSFVLQRGGQINCPLLRGCSSTDGLDQKNTDLWLCSSMDGRAPVSPTDGHPFPRSNIFDSSPALFQFRCRLGGYGTLVDQWVAAFLESKDCRLHPSAGFVRDEESRR